MDPITCFFEANPDADQVCEIAYNGNIIPVIFTPSITNFLDLHYIESLGEDVDIEELGNTGEYIAISTTWHPKL